MSTVAKVVERLQRDGGGSAGPLEFAAGAKDVQAMLHDRLAEDRSIDSLFIVGADGKIGNSERARLMSIADLRGQDHLDALRNASADAVYVSTPFQSMTSGAWQLSLSKRVSANDGSFLGVVTGVVKLASFEDVLEKAAPGEHASVSIFREDGSIVACFPQREIAFGADIAKSDLYARFISKKLNGVTRQTSDVDRIERMFAVVNSHSFPVASVVAVAMNDLLADWLFQAEALAFGAAVIVLAIASRAISLAFCVEQLAAAREREAVQAQVAVQYKRFNNAMDNIVQGLAMYDKSSALIACNRRYAEIYGLPAEIAGLGSPSGVRAFAQRRFGKPIDEPRQEADGSVLRQRAVGRTHHRAAQEEARRMAVGLDARGHHRAPPRPRKRSRKWRRTTR